LGNPSNVMKCVGVNKYYFALQNGAGRGELLVQIVGAGRWCIKGRQRSKS